MKQTTVEWFALELYEKFEMKGDGILFNEILEQAKEMEKDVAQQYAEFAIECDRKELPVLEFDGWINL
jgi:hypothetical protein